MMGSPAQAGGQVLQIEVCECDILKTRQCRGFSLMPQVHLLLISDQMSGLFENLVNAITREQGGVEF